MGRRPHPRPISGVPSLDPPFPHAPAVGSVCAQGRPLVLDCGPCRQETFAHCCIPEVKTHSPTRGRCSIHQRLFRTSGGQTPGAGAEHRGRDRPLGPTWGWGGPPPYLGYPVPPPGQAEAPLTDSLLHRVLLGQWTLQILALLPTPALKRDTHCPCPSVAAGSRGRLGGRLEGAPGCLLGQGGRVVQGAPSLQEAHGALAAPRGLWGEKRSHRRAGPRD